MDAVLVSFMGCCFINKPFMNLNGIFLHNLQLQITAAKKTVKTVQGSMKTRSVLDHQRAVFHQSLPSIAASLHRTSEADKAETQIQSKVTTGPINSCCCS